MADHEKLGQGTALGAAPPQETRREDGSLNEEFRQGVVLNAAPAQEMYRDDGELNEAFLLQEYGLSIEEVSRVVSFNGHELTLGEVIANPKCPYGSMLKAAYQERGGIGADEQLLSVGIVRSEATRERAQQVREMNQQARHQQTTAAEPQSTESKAPRHMPAPVASREYEVRLNSPADRQMSEDFIRGFAAQQLKTAVLEAVPEPAPVATITPAVVEAVRSVPPPTSVVQEIINSTLVAPEVPAEVPLTEVFAEASPEPMAESIVAPVSEAWPPDFVEQPAVADLIEPTELAEVVDLALEPVYEIVVPAVEEEGFVPLEPVEDGAGELTIQDVLPELPDQVTPPNSEARLVQTETLQSVGVEFEQLLETLPPPQAAEVAGIVEVLEGLAEIVQLQQADELTEEQQAIAHEEIIVLVQRLFEVLEIEYDEQKLEDFVAFITSEAQPQLAESSVSESLTGYLTGQGTHERKSQSRSNITDGLLRLLQSKLPVPQMIGRYTLQASGR